ncbi:MAG: hypothetical protein IT340_20000 [Chloroflexi bacterium]|nr:hypothetical protein [Chloroflexota bacterium]
MSNTLSSWAVREARRASDGSLRELVRHAALADILALDGIDQYHALSAWLDLGRTSNGALVKVVTSDGKPLATAEVEDGQRVVVGPQGKRVTRELAVRLLLGHGQHGTYTGRDIATGYSRLKWAQFKQRYPAEAAAMEETLPAKMNFCENWLRHEPDGDGDAALVAARLEAASERRDDKLALAAAKRRARGGQDDVPEGIMLGAVPGTEE